GPGDLPLLDVARRGVAAEPRPVGLVDRQRGVGQRGGLIAESAALDNPVIAAAAVERVVAGSGAAQHEGVVAAAAGVVVVTPIAGIHGGGQVRAVREGVAAAAVRILNGDVAEALIEVVGEGLIDAVVVYDQAIQVVGADEGAGIDADADRVVAWRPRDLQQAGRAVARGVGGRSGVTNCGGHKSGFECLQAQPALALEPGGRAAPEAT